MMFNFFKFLDLSFLIDPNPPTDFATRYIFIGLFGIFVVLSFVSWIVINRLEKKYSFYHELKYRLFYFFIFFGIIGLALVFFRIEGIPYFSSRLFGVLFLICFLAWFGTVVYYLIKKLPREITEYKIRSRKEKYLPRSNKKR